MYSSYIIAGHHII